MPTDLILDPPTSFLLAWLSAVFAGASITLALCIAFGVNFSGLTVRYIKEPKWPPSDSL